MFSAQFLLTLALVPQAVAAPSGGEFAVISARLGTCSADFTVTDADGRPEYAATIHVRLRYGFMNIKRMDLEVGTGSDGRARVEGLPLRAKNPLTYDISKGQRKAIVQQDVTIDCRADYKVSLKP